MAHWRDFLRADEAEQLAAADAKIEIGKQAIQDRRHIVVRCWARLKREQAKTAGIREINKRIFEAAE